MISYINQKIGCNNEDLKLLTLSETRKSILKEYNSKRKRNVKNIGSDLIKKLIDKRTVSFGMKDNVLDIDF
eukprot:CAMPEP_0116934086 /NCGR_PEP_ID=MMETSP0467-20121206/29426_1 /TAXON_ID=283647 /ORGANISM="Mesodinium pulex, Strain SPMC105" /LENGTH=70 /DNA_ID=CAMNT_0004615097 /DNA_START=193 /DNA_END=405 /DNA_ORIENTATION=+